MNFAVFWGEIVGAAWETELKLPVSSFKFLEKENREITGFVRGWMGGVYKQSVTNASRVSEEKMTKWKLLLLPLTKQMTQI